ncbi:MAG: DUF3047 domain-containing protein [Candidatus Omnitrophota bacterium]
MRSIIALFVVICVGIIGLWGYAYASFKWFPFNREDALEEWEEKIFRNKVLYRVETELEGGYLLAKSNRACSGLIYRLRFYPKKAPMISWKWKVNKFPAKNNADSDGGWIEKDDYAARVYVIFPSWYFMHIRTIEYVWDERNSAETIMTSPYFSNIKMIVVESGRENIGQWVKEERNIYDDYKKAFGRPPRGYVGAIALMTDTDNTLSTAEALYKDIRVGYRQNSKFQIPNSKQTQNPNLQ